jgi:2-polyprenyl-3-methyl-5-hydroxy-6-metoxy-1,4-benzoquinol methylase
VAKRWSKRIRRRLQSTKARARRQKSNWERNWRVESERPVEDLSTVVPDELKLAVAEGWLPAGSRVMDVGSGRGQISAWLAEQGFSVLGVDLADAATELALRHYSALAPRLEFRTVDVCLDRVELGPFDAFLDRGCFQSVPDRPRYVENVLRWSKPEARLLLFHRVDDRDVGSGDLSTLERRLEQQVRRSFERHFEIEKACPTTVPMSRSAGPIPRVTKPGMVFWMIRR